MLEITLVSSPKLVKDGKYPSRWKARCEGFEIAVTLIGLNERMRVG